MIKSFRSLSVPSTRVSYLFQNWTSIINPLLKMDAKIRYNLSTKHIDISCTNYDKSLAYLNAIIIGFNFEYCLPFLNTNYFLESFTIQEIKTLKNDHYDRAIGRIIGTHGKIKSTIENATNCKILVNDQIHIIGSLDSIKMARFAISRLVMGAECSKVCEDLWNVRKKVIDKHGVIETLNYKLE